MTRGKKSQYVQSIIKLKEQLTLEYCDKVCKKNKNSTYSLTPSASVVICSRDIDEGLLLLI